MANGKSARLRCASAFAALWRDESARRKGDPGKVAIAERLRRETTVTLGWIADRLQMGTQTHLAHLLYWKRRNEN